MRSLPLLLLLAACAAPAPPTLDGTDAEDTPSARPIDEPAFDAEAWIKAVEAADTPAEQIVLSERLLDAVDWRTASGEDDPTAPRRGTVRIVHLDDPWSLAAVTCQAYETQSAFALVDARGGRPPRLVRALGVSESGQPTADTTASFFGVLSHDRNTATNRFDILTKSADHGGCGLDVRYRLLPDGGAAIERVRVHDDCEDPTTPEDWPVTYRD